MDTNSPQSPECATSNPTLIYDNLNPVQFIISGNVTISGVNLSGKTSLLSGCNTEKCMYCGVMTLAADGTGTDDQGIVHSPGSFVTSNACSPFMYFSLMFLQPGASLRLFNLTTSDFRQGLGSLFTMTSGYLTLESVTLVNISTSSVPNYAWWASSSVTHAIIQQNCTNSVLYLTPGTTYASGEILLSKVITSLINNGYELTTGLLQYGLLSVNGIKSVRIVNCTFSNTLVQYGGFISLFTFLTFSIDNCVFDIMYVEGYFIQLAPTGLMTLTPGPDNEPDEYYLDHISITNTIFNRVSLSIARFNYLPAVLIFINILEHGMNMHLENVTFSNCVTTQYLLFFSHHVTSLAPGEMEDTNVNYDKGTATITMTVPKVWTRFKSVTFDSIFAGVTLVVLNYLTNVEFSNLTMINSGETSADMGVNVMTLSYLIGKPGVYLTQMLQGDSLSHCMCTVTIESSYNVSILNSRFENDTCNSLVPISTLDTSWLVPVSHSGQGGISTAALLGTFNMSNVEMINLRGPSIDAGTALVLDTSGLITLTNVNVISCVNSGSSINGIISITSTSTVGVFLTDCRFKDNLSQGASLQIQGGSALTITSSSFLYNKSKSQAAVYFLPGASFSCAQVTITASQFLFNSGGDGTAVYLSNIALHPITLTVQISSTVFLSNSGTGAGTAVWIDNKNALEGVNFLKNCTFINNTANDGVVNVAFLSGSLGIEDCTFINNTGQTVAGISASQQPNTPATPTFLSVSSSYFSGNTGISLITLKNPNGFEQLYSSNNRFENNEMMIFDVDKTIIVDSGSVYENNAGSAFYATTLSEISVTDALFVNGTNSVGGAVYLGGGSILNCSNCTFEGNVAATYGGAVYVEQDSAIVVRDSQFIRNHAGLRGSAVYIFGSTTNSSFRNALFQENESGDSATLAAVSSRIQFFSCTFLRNRATKTALIIAYFSNVFLTNSTVAEHWNLSSPLIYSALESNLYISGCSFLGVETISAGGVVYALSSQLIIAATTFSNIRAFSGALLLSEAGSVFSISDSCVQNVSATNSFGGVIFASAGSGQISRTKFETYLNSAIIGTSLSSLILSEVSFLGKSYSDGSGITGGALYCSGCTYVSVEQSTFSSLTADTGAAVYLTASTQQMAVTFSRFTSCEFSNLTSSGTAVYIYNGNADFQTCNFEHCRALSSIDGSGGSGGAMSLYCPDSPGGCEVTIDSCEFVNNSATIQGGSIYWQDSKPIIQFSGFTGGSAFYGPDIASFPVGIHITAIEGNATINTNKSAGNLTNESEGVLLNIASGQIANQIITASLLDHYGQVVLTNKGTYATIGTSVNNTSVTGTTTFSVANGTFTLTGFGITAPPETSTTIYVRTNAINIGKDADARDNLTYSDSVQLSAAMRACQIGESQVELQCVVCPSGKYSLDPKKSCQDCNPAAICYGNYTMVPRGGYWRSNIYTDVFWSCPYAPACTGSPEPPQQLALTGECAPGYFGNLCNGCLPGFSRQNQAGCSACPSKVINALELSGIGVLVLLFLVLVVATAIRAAHKSQSYISIYIKILLNYLQLVMLTANFNLSWPTYVVELFKVQQSAGSVTDQVFSIDCFLNNSNNDSQANAVRTKIVILAALPLGLFLVSFLIWLPIAIIRRKYAHLKNEMMTTCVVCFFLVHPSIVKFMFDFLNCRQLDPGEYWMSSYLNVECWDSIHYRYALAVALPSILVWGVGLPTLCLIYLISHHDQLDLIYIKLRLGFIYNGYERKKYFWELVILYRKILIISIAVFLSNISVYIQALTVMLVILVALGLQSKNNPYIVPDMNELELRGILVGGVTIYCGMYCLSQSLDYTPQLILFIVIVLSNVYFLLTWIVRSMTASIQAIAKKCPCFKLLLRGKNSRALFKVQNSSLPLVAINQDPNKVNNSFSLSRVSIIQLGEDEENERRIPRNLVVPENSSLICDKSLRREQGSDDAQAENSGILRRYQSCLK